VRSPSEKEGAAEQQLVRTSLQPEAMVAFIDRQVVVPGSRLKRLDVVGLTREPNPVCILGEVKRWENPDIPELPSQLFGYYQLFADTDGRVKGTMYRAYQRVVEQKHQLGLLPTDLHVPSEPPPVLCLVVLCDYSAKSRYGPEAEQRLREGPVPVRKVHTSTPGCLIPPITEWETIR